MAFSDFQYPDVLDRFGLTEQTVPDLFGGVPSVPVPSGFDVLLQRNAQVALSINTEKARSEWLIAPVLGEFFLRHAGVVNLHSGTWFDADPADGLSGYSDFLLGRGPQRPQLTVPILVVVEAKNENIYQGFGQCIAGMVGARRHAARRGVPLETVFGCSTIGTNWRFLRLTGADLAIDLREYLFSETGRILGILTHMLGPLPVPAAA